MKHRILVVDDEPAVHDSLRRMLAHQRGVWELRSAGGVDEALALLETTECDLVVTDVLMPFRSGFDLLAALRAAERTRDVPVIVVTGVNDHTLKRRALDEGATDLLCKPVDPDDLRARIASALRMKEYQDAIRNQNAELERRVAERTAMLQRALDELRVLDRMKDEFLSCVSHELRTPLTSIRAAAEILIQLGDEASPDGREFLGILMHESERLTERLQQILDLVHLQADAEPWAAEPRDLAELAREAARTVAQRAHEKGLAVFVEVHGGDTTVPVAGDRVRRVVDHLLANAIKFSPPGGRIRVQVTGEEDGVAVIVADQGDGIAAADHERIFDRFQQVVRTRTGKPDGTGLGLAVCRVIVERHGGRIGVDSAPGAGSRFQFRLPRRCTGIQVHAPQVPSPVGR